ncbi:hypothetical protein JRO89_XS10G0031800 [Xanthoceras sorbifolium]|uniref:Uncharacterized protein n=1 Tax=Xanthoceras sorbifolium TaxID=99658 RepID=A0ABQ8HHH4_9ROSI|nr:hypothetical protein JRO89_XS10G0031800 [Xanthoceras sorbifolium]
MDLVIHQEDFEDLSSNNISQMKGLSKDGSEEEEITNDASNTPKLDEASSSSFGKGAVGEDYWLASIESASREECATAPKNDSLQDHEIINEMVPEETVVEAKEWRRSGRERKANIVNLQRKRKSKCQEGAVQNRWKMKRESQKG